MEQKVFNQITSQLSTERTKFHYFRDYYALCLLQLACPDSMSLAELRNTALGKLLDKSAARPLLAMCGDGRVTPERLNLQWQEPSTAFLLTVGKWHGDGSWGQTSRSGCNLVLRLNFTADHDRQFRKLLGVERDGLFNGWGHPVMQRGERSYFRETLAWARLDFDPERGEVLIEEIQSDWIRRVLLLKKRVRAAVLTKRPVHWYGLKFEPLQLQHYIDRVFAPYDGIWDQAMLCAAIQFCVEELNIRNFWYHTWKCGAVIKRIGLEYGPPQSLYSTLPKRFCFTETTSMPEMLRRRDVERRLRKSKVQPRFFRLQL